MIEILRGYALLRGTRGEKPTDIPALSDAILRLSKLLCDFPEIREIDLNPVRIYPTGEGVCALDARIIL
jgi:acyl-CoA synthetase (NDP forming)